MFSNSNCSMVKCKVFISFISVVICLVASQKEKEEEQKLHEEVQLLEFVRVRQNLRKAHTALQKNLHS